MRHELKVTYNKDNSYIINGLGENITRKHSIEELKEISSKIILIDTNSSKKMSLKSNFPYLHILNNLELQEIFLSLEGNIEIYEKDFDLMEAYYFRKKT